MLLIPLHFKRKLSVCHFKKTFCTRRLCTYNKISDFFLGTNTVKQMVVVIQIFLDLSWDKNSQTNGGPDLDLYWDKYSQTNDCRDLDLSWDKYSQTNGGLDLDLYWNKWWSCSRSFLGHKYSQTNCGGDLGPVFQYQCCSQDARLRDSPLLPRNPPFFSLEGARLIVNNNVFLVSPT